MRDPQLRQRTTEMLKELELTDVADRNAGKFSRGMLQRVGLAQALVNDPELLILDEPASALDPLGRMRVREILLRAREAGKTVFLSSHLLSEVEQICDRLAIVIKGRVARVGTLAELLESQDRFVITAKGIDALMFEGSQQNGFIKITVPALTQRRTIEKIWLAGGEVIAVNPIRRTLEDLFVELANQNGGGHRDDRRQPGARMKTWIKMLALVLPVFCLRLSPKALSPSGKSILQSDMAFRPLIAPSIFAGRCIRACSLFRPKDFLCIRSTVRAQQTRLAPRDASGGSGNFILEIKILNAADGSEIKSLQLPTNAEFSKVIATRDGKFIVRTGDILYLYSADFTRLASHALPLKRQ